MPDRATRFAATLCLALALLLPLPAAAAGEYAVQFTVPSNREQVWKFVEMLSDLGYPSYMFTQDRGAGLVHYYAQMGTYGSFDAAHKAAEQLQQKVRVDYEIVQANSNKVVTREEAAAAPEKPAGPDISEKQPEAAPAPKPAPDPEPAKAPKPAPEQTPASDTAQAPAPKPAPEKKPAAQAAQAPAAQAAPEPAPAAKAAAPLPAPSTAPPQDTVFLVQTHSFSIKQNALEAARDYADKGYSPLIILLYDDSHTPWYVLTLGHYPDRKSAMQAKSTFQALEDRSPTLNQVDADFLQTRVVPY